MWGLRNKGFGIICKNFREIFKNINKWRGGRVTKAHA